MKESLESDPDVGVEMKGSLRVLRVLKIDAQHPNKNTLSITKHRSLRKTLEIKVNIPMRGTKTIRYMPQPFCTSRPQSWNLKCRQLRAFSFEPLVRQPTWYGLIRSPNRQCRPTKFPIHFSTSFSECVCEYDFFKASCNPNPHFHNCVFRWNGKFLPFATRSCPGEVFVY